MSFPTPIRRALKWVLVRTGVWKRIEDGRLVPDPAVVIPNFIFQRILGVNRDCPWAVHYTSRVVHPKNIQIGKRVAFSFAISGGVYIQAANGVLFGDDVIFGPGTKIISANHDTDNLFADSIPDRPISIGSGCWIGANAVILPGVTLGEGVVVGAGSIVTKSFPPRVIVVGNPARIVRDIQRVGSEEADLVLKDLRMSRETGIRK